MSLPCVSLLRLSRMVYIHHRAWSISPEGWCNWIHKQRWADEKTRVRGREIYRLENKFLQSVWGCARSGKAAARRFVRREWGSFQRAVKAYIIDNRLGPTKKFCISALSQCNRRAFDRMSHSSRSPNGYCSILQRDTKRIGLQDRNISQQPKIGALSATDVVRNRHLLTIKGTSRSEFIHNDPTESITTTSMDAGILYNLGWHH